MLGSLGPLHPTLDDETYVFVCLPELRPDLDAVAIVRETEGVTHVIPGGQAEHHGLEGEFPCARITLALPTALDLVGLMAQVATALADAGISCNPVAGFHHDHLFVPADRAREAVAAIEALA